jgi:NADH-quinone oxidoreductase subunit N
VVAAVWMRAPGESAAGAAAVGPGGARPAIAGGSTEADADPDAVAASERLAGATRRLIQPEVIALAVVCAVATVVFGIYPSPLLDVAQDVGAALTNLF